MFSFLYTIPSTMDGDKWIHFASPYQNHKIAARRAVLHHFKGSELPDEIEIHVRIRGDTQKNPTRVKKFIVRQIPGEDAEVRRAGDPVRRPRQPSAPRLYWQG